MYTFCVLDTKTPAPETDVGAWFKSLVTSRAVAERFALRLVLAAVHWTLGGPVGIHGRLKRELGDGRAASGTGQIQRGHVDHRPGTALVVIHGGLGRDC